MNWTDFIFGIISAIIILYTFYEIYRGLQKSKSGDDR